MKQRPFFILLNGPMGAGKSTTVNLLKKKLKKTAAIRIEDVRHLVSGEVDHALAWKVIYRMCDEYFKNKVNVILEQSVASVELADQFISLAKKYKYKVLFYNFVAPKPELRKRIKQRSKEKAPKDLVTSNHNKHEQINYPGSKRIDTSLINRSQIIKQILRDV